LVLGKCSLTQFDRNREDGSRGAGAVLRRFAPLAFLCALVLFAVEAAHAADIIGTPGKVSDGDTLWVCDEVACHRIRLCGIDAPELRAQRGPEAREALRALVTGKAITCTRVGEGSVCDGRSRPTSFDRIVAQCFINGVDVANKLVEAGHACDWTRFSGGHNSRESERAVCRK
jgi:endonuclease YncB( thermonuclease family)